MDETVVGAGSAEVLAVPAATAVAWMREAVLATAIGELAGPVRVSADVGAGSFTVTAGRRPDVANGFRVSSTVPETADDTTLVFRPGQPLGVVRGRDLGRRRTGALGGVAAAACARPDAAVLGLIGAGEQAFTQLWAIAAVRRLTEVRVWTRNPDRAGAFVTRTADALGLTVTAAPDARSAVAGADVVVLATPSPEPLVEADWIAPGAHVHTLGVKGSQQGECPHELVARATLLVSDSPAQLSAMEGPDAPWTGGRAVVALADVLAGTRPGRTGAQDLTLYASVGLAGTEVWFAAELLNRL